MTIAEPLNRLITAVSVDTKMGRNEVCFKVRGKKRGTISVTPHYPEKKGLFAFFMRGKGPMRYIRIATARSVAIVDMKVDCQDVQSEVKYGITLRFDVQTPDKDNPSALQKMIEVFADTIPDSPSHTNDDPDSGPSSRFRNEMLQWLASRYRSGDRIKTSAEWRLTQSEEIGAYIADEYGFDANVKLIINRDSTRLKPVEVSVETKACDSRIDIELPLMVGCELDSNKDLFEAVTLSDADLRKIIDRRVDRFIRDHVTLQQFRFENAWIDDLEQAIETDLQAKGRTITSFIVEHSPASTEYEMGPVDVKTDAVDFIPAGWDKSNTISFVSNAQVRVENAAIHEPLFEASDFNKMKPYLHDWFTKALGVAIHDCLHQIHDKNVGYATLLTDWDSTFQKNIRSLLERMAKESGLSADAIISNPERPEVKLPQGVWIHIPEENGEAQMFSDDGDGVVSKAFASMTPSVSFKMSVDAHIRIRNFVDIKDILNQTTDALAFIREQLIEPAVRRVCQTTNTITYFSTFEFVNEGVSFTDLVREEVKKALNARNIELITLMLRSDDRHISERFARVTGAPPERVKFYIDPLVKGANISDVSGLVPVGFDLNITSICANGAGWGQFVPLIWPDEVQETGAYYQFVYNKVSETISTKFQAGDIETIKYAEFSAEEKKDFEVLLNKYVNEILDRNFGLMGEAISIKRELSDQEQVYVGKRGYAIDHQKRLLQAEQAKDISRLNAAVQLTAVEEAARIQDASENVDTRMPGDVFGAPGDIPELEDFGSLEFGDRKTKTEQPSQDSSEDTPPKKPEGPSPTDDDIYDMPPEDDGKP